MPTESLKEKAAKGLFWGTLSSATLQLIGALAGIVTARLLTPTDYGIVGMLAIFGAIATNLMDSGFSNALVNIKEIRHNDYNSVFWYNVAIGVSLYIILFFCAPLIASFYHQPALTLLSRVMFTTFVIASLTSVHGAYMLKNIMAKERAIVTFVAVLLSSIVGIVVALHGYGYWSIAWQQVTVITLIGIGRIYYTRWFPTLQIDFAPIKKMFAFSNRILITSIVNSVNSYALASILGRLFPVNLLGNYTQANKWNVMGYSLISGSVQQIAQPVLVSANEDKERQKRIFRKIIRFTAFLSFPLMFGLVIISREFIVVLITDKWLTAVPLLQILCVGGAFMPFYTVYQNLFMGRGKGTSYMWLSISQAAIQIIVVIISYSYGVTIMVSAFSMITILMLLVWQFFAKKYIGLRLRDVLHDILPFMLISATVMAGTYFATSFIHNMLLLLTVRIVIAAALYLIIMRLLNAEIMNECIRYLFKRKK